MVSYVTIFSQNGSLGLFFNWCFFSILFFFIIWINSNCWRQLSVISTLNFKREKLMNIWIWNNPKKKKNFSTFYMNMNFLNQKYAQIENKATVAPAIISNSIWLNLQVSYKLKLGARFSGDFFALWRMKFPTFCFYY